MDEILSFIKITFKNFVLWLRYYYTIIREKYWPYKTIRLWWVLLAIFILMLLVITIIAYVNRKRKIYFYVGNSRYKKIKCRFKKKIKFPKAPTREGFEFVCWCKDKTFKEPFTSEVLEEKKSVRLYACFKQVEAVDNILQNALQVQNGNTTNKPQGNDGAGQKAIDIARQQAMAQQQAIDAARKTSASSQVQTVQYTSQYFYDEIRYAMLGYERAPQFKKLGVVSKQIIAEMFEKGGVVYLYLVVDPDIMKEKGFNVSRYEEEQFSIVPCKKVVKTKEDLEDALRLVKETMAIHNLIKSETAYVQRPVSTEQSRKSGFAFFVKNEQVATTADDYYRLLRGIVLSYKTTPGVKVDKSIQNKMVLKIYKKEETIFVYLALDPSEDGLVNVGYDRNFSDTPAMLTVNTYEDCLKANELIDKLMFRYGMERYPERAEISDAPIEKNCGFGYRIKN